MINHSNDTHLEAIRFQATVTYSTEICLRTLEFMINAYKQAVAASEVKMSRACNDSDAALEVKVKAMEIEIKYQSFFNGPGIDYLHSSLVIQGFATLETIADEAIRLLTAHTEVESATAGRTSGSNLSQNIEHLEKVFGSVFYSSEEDRQLLDDFREVRNALVHQGYFLPEEHKRFIKLTQSDWHHDYFELNAGNPIHFHENGVMEFLRLVKRIGEAIGNNVFERLTASED
jgi:hypothetical protein